ncbi:uncharacterized protein F4822DRAFT_73352 [Hypoxylon trugodes]|uniref:uncharacterized protein n=1 Tax=Hypoxylon trugodes TaxID=326681 RepID=UPI00219D2FFA|nr:uncharacterized protein F4822DRAFT_73352 [Hypoxylon trugodes]KAI1383320.1 hypothetical protein F4822DRAFT_73352 [Hypoxylon trugodes]
MNASASLRASFYGPDGPLGLPPQNARDPRRHTMAGDVEALRWRKTLVPVDYADYSSYCREMKETASQESVFDVEQAPEPPSIMDQIGRMFTIWPYRDANWVIAMLFVVGSISFTINAFFALLSAFIPETLFDNEIELAIPLTTLFGALMFVSGGNLALVAGWNADKGTFEPVEYKTEDGSTKMYKPALLGSSAWSWIPTMTDFKTAMRTVPFQSSLVQFFGGMILSITVVGGWPGVLSPDDIMGSQLFLFGPLSIGGTMFFLANLSLLIWLQDRWYKPKPGSAAWQATFWSSVGSANFAIAGFSLFLEDMGTSTIASFIGSWTFFIGAVFQWYDLMAFHPDGWAA